MKSSRLVTAVVASLVAVAAVVAQSAAASNVVLGNLGSSGTNSVGNLNQDIGPTAAFSLAQGFTAASPNLSVQSVSLWLFGESTSANVAIYDATSIIPVGGPGDPVAVSSSLTIGAKGLYQFNFSGANLQNGTNYWIVPQGDVSWYSASGAPTEQNGSGYVYSSALQMTTGGFWEPAAVNTMSVSVQAVPEPSTYALSALGIIATGVMQWRRRAARKGR